jgi:hypothetical protein
MQFYVFFDLLFCHADLPCPISFIIWHHAALSFTADSISALVTFSESIVFSIKINHQLFLFHQRFIDMTYIKYVNELLI